MNPRRYYFLLLRRRRAPGAAADDDAFAGADVVVVVAAAVASAGVDAVVVVVASIVASIAVAVDCRRICLILSIWAVEAVKGLKWRRSPQQPEQLKRTLQDEVTCEMILLHHHHRPLSHC